MKLKVIGTGSKGNAYLLEGAHETLLLECGVNIRQIKQALNFNFSRVVGALVTHHHNDHSVAMKDVVRLGVKTYALKETFIKTGVTGSRKNEIEPHKPFKVGSFKVVAFEVEHDCPCVGFLIHHAECGTVAFITDTFYCAYTFPGLNNIIVEANYSKEIIDRKMKEGASPEFLRNRILKSHFSLENCKELLKANDLSRVNNIVLIHLSDSNSHEENFKKEVQELTGKNVTVASNGMEISFNKTPF